MELIPAMRTDSPQDKTRTGPSREATLTTVMRSLLHRRSKSVDSPLIANRHCGGDFSLPPRFGHTAVKFLLLYKSGAQNEVDLSSLLSQGHAGQLRRSAARMSAAVPLLLHFC